MSDIAIAVREGADAVMLSGETAYGRFPFKSLDIMTTVARRTELSMLKYTVCGAVRCALCVLWGVPVAVLCSAVLWGGMGASWECGSVCHWEVGVLNQKRGAM